MQISLIPNYLTKLSIDSTKKISQHVYPGLIGAVTSYQQLYFCWLAYFCYAKFSL